MYAIYIYIYILFSEFVGCYEDCERCTVYIIKSFIDSTKLHQQRIQE